MKNVLFLALLSFLSACAEPADVHESQSDLGVPSGAQACGVVEGCSYYGYYDGCNYCSCSADGGRGACTARYCENGSAPAECNPTYYGLPSTSAGSWVCGAEARVFHSSCVPAP